MSRRGSGGTPSSTLEGLLRENYGSAQVTMEAARTPDLVYTDILVQETKNTHRLMEQGTSATSQSRRLPLSSWRVHHTLTHASE